MKNTRRTRTPLTEGFRVTVSDDFWVRPYRPPTFSSAVVLTLVVLSAVLSSSRGFSYAFGSTPGSTSLLVLEAIAPMEFWGLTLLGGGVALLTSLVFRIHSAVWASHVYLTALNVALLISVTQSIFIFGGGYAEAIPFVTASVWHGVFVYLTNPFRHEERR